MNIFKMLTYAVTMLVGGLGAFNILMPLMPALIGGCMIASVSVLVVRFLLMK